MSIADQINLIQEKLKSLPKDINLQDLKLKQPPRDQIEEDLTPENISEKFLLPKPQFSDKWLDQLQELPSINILEQTSQLFSVPTFQAVTDIKFTRAGLNGNIIGYSEITSQNDFALQSAKNSLSITRDSAGKSENVKGRIGNMPFAPGGVKALEEDDKKPLNLSRDSEGLFNVAPGLSRGVLDEIAFKDSKGAEDEEFVLSENIDSTQGDEEDFQVDSDIKIDEAVDELRAMTLAETKDTEEADTKDSELIKSSEIDALLPDNITFGRIKNNGPIIPKAKDWAHVVDVNKQITNFDELVPSPAKEYPFELDTFQKEAVYHLEQGDSVFVAAHTSAGKTVVAEYAISMAMRNMTKAIYTSPIKALSNQKFRDFQEVFDDVGILTGDVQINPEASCLIMTTEILRSMLYRGADVIRDVEFVIFDEVHYVNDQDRGVVWEEVIIMLPEHIKLILLSATVPNTFEFANWVGRTKQKNIYVISTPKRPVPLEHYIWAKNEKIKIVDSEKKFLPHNFQEVKNIIIPPKTPAGQQNNSTRGGSQRGGAQAGGRGGRGGAQRGGRGGGQTGNSRQFVSGVVARGDATKLLNPLCAHLLKNKLLPAVFFVFSQKKTMTYALSLSTADYNTALEKSQVRQFISQAVSRLRKEDRELPQIAEVSEMLVRGIGVHHGGLLPILKEVVEILFARTLVKVLFATETFAMGLNLPTKTVVFTETEKFDGHTRRPLHCGEYTQMAGRAGRRGLDPTGTVILLISETDVYLPEKFRELILGTPTKLQSQFRLTYNMILNLLRIEALKVEEMIKRSFSENTNQVMLPEHQNNIKTKKALLETLHREACQFCDPDIEHVTELIDEHAHLTEEIYKFYTKSSVSHSAYAQGRIVVVKLPGNRRAVGVVNKLERNDVHVYIVSQIDTKPSLKDNLPFFSNVPGYSQRNMPNIFTIAKKITLVSIPISSIEFIVKIQMKSNPNNLLKSKSSKGFAASMEELAAIFQYQNEWNPFHKALITVDYAIKDSERQKIMNDIQNSSCIKCPKFTEHYSIELEKFNIGQNLQDLKQLISNENMELLPDYKQRIEVLQELNYIDQDQNVLLKGRVACEISTGFELVITELVLDNFLASYEPEEIVALLSVFLFRGSNNSEGYVPITPKLDLGRAKIIEVFEKTMDVFVKHQVSVTEEESTFFEGDRFALMEPIYEWGRGMYFKDIMQITDVAEGTIIRVITRLDEVCRQTMNAARIIGDASLHEKMLLAQEKIKRDIVFCSSLYL